MNWQVNLLEQSMTKLAPMGERVAARFYEVLFEEYPSLRNLFQGGVDERSAQEVLVSLGFNLITAVGSRKSAQPLHAPRKFQQSLITRKVTMSCRIPYAHK